MGATAHPTPRASGSLVISYGLINVSVKYAPVIEKAARLGGKFLDPATKQPATQQYVNDAGQPVEKVTGYAHGDGFVVLSQGEAAAIKAQRDGRLELKAFVDKDTLDPFFFEKDHIVWPERGHEAAYDVLCTVLERSGRWLIGTTILDATRAIVLRYAHGCLLAHVCRYDATVRWGNKRLVSDAHTERPDPDAALVELAEQVFSALPDTFDVEAVVDDYDMRLRAAVEAAAEGKPVPKEKQVEATPAVDLMEALKATIAASGEQKKKPAAKKRKTAA